MTILNIILIVFGIGYLLFMLYLAYYVLFKYEFKIDKAPPKIVDDILKEGDKVLVKDCIILSDEVYEVKNVIDK